MPVQEEKQGQMGGGQPIDKLRWRRKVEVLGKKRRQAQAQ